MIIRNKLLLFSAVLTSLFTAFNTYAVCPVCTLAVVCGVGLSRWLGIDDVISGLWIGGLIVSAIVWTYNWLKSKNWDFKFSLTAIAISYYGIVLLPLKYMDIVGHPLNKLWGVDKILLGTAIGSITFILATALHEFLKKKNGGKSYFPYQKVVFPVASLIILSLIFYIFICKN